MERTLVIPHIGSVLETPLKTPEMHNFHVQIIAYQVVCNPIAARGLYIKEVTTYLVTTYLFSHFINILLNYKSLGIVWSLLQSIIPESMLFPFVVYLNLRHDTSFLKST